MKKNNFLTLILFTFSMYGQVTNYSFNSFNGSYNPITGTQIIAPGVDDGNSSATNIGFDFVFNGITFTQFVANSNGFIRLGSSAPASNAYQAISSTSSSITNTIAFFSRDGKAVGGVFYETTGNAPNRVLTIQFTSHAPVYSATSNIMDAQILLYETSNQIDIIYGASTTSSSTTGQVGIRGSNSSDYQNRSTSSNWSSTIAGTSNSSTVTFSSTVSPVSGLSFRWSPPAPCQAPVDQATSLTFGSISNSSISGSFTAAATAPSGYLVVRSTSATPPTPTDGTTYSTGSTSLGAGTSVVQSSSATSFTNSSLTGNTTYYYYIFSYNNTSCSGGPIYLSASPLSLSTTTCVSAPSVSAATSISTNAFTANWSASNGGASSYLLYLATDNSFNNIVSGYNGLDVGNVITYAVTGLSASTTYYYRLVAVGSSCNSSNSSTIIVSTSCEPEIAPTQVQDFSTFTGAAPAPICWSESSGALTSSSTLSGTTSNWLNKSNGFANANSSNVGASINLYGNSTNWLISNEIDLGNIAGLYRLKYKYAVTTYNGTSSVSTLSSHKVEIVISTDGGNTWSNTNIIKTYVGSGTYSNTGTEELINLTSFSGVVKIAFVATCISSSDIDFHIDDVQIEAIPSCLAPTNLTTMVITPTSTILSWDENGSATLWDLELNTSGFTPTGIPTESGINSYPHTYFGLIPNTSYDFYVRADCGGGDYSAWIGPYSFTTSKIAPTNQVTNLNTGTISASSIPLTWTAANTGSQLPDGYLVKASSVSLASITNPVDGTDPSNVTSFTSNAANKKVTTGTSTGTTSFSGMTSGTMYHYKVFSYTNSGSSIIFNTEYPATLSHATKPNSVSSTLANVVLAENSINFDWTLPTGYQSGSNEIIIFAKENSAITLGTPVLDLSTYTPNTSFGSGTVYEADADAFCVYKGDGNSIAISELNASTTYHFLIYVVVENANSNGSFSYSTGTSVNRITTCAVVTSYPYTEGFNNATLPVCYSATEGSSGASQHWEPVTADASNGVGSASEGTHFLRMNYYLASTSKNPYYLNFPVFNLGNTNKIVSFDLWMGATSGSNNLIFQISVDGGVTWTDLQTFTANSSNTTSSSPWQTGIQINLSSYVNQTVTFRLKANSNYGSGYCNIGFDNFKIEIPSIIWSSQAWSNASGPTSSDNATIDDNLTTTTDINCKDLTINSGKTLTIDVGHSLNISGNLVNNGQIIFKSNVSGSGMFDSFSGTSTGSGTVQVERFIPSKRAFRFVSPSVTTTSPIRENWQENGGTTAGLGTHITGTGGATNGFDVTATNNPSMFGFNHNTGQWVAVTNTNVNTLTAGTPYRLMVRGDRNTDLTTNTPTATATTLRATGSLKTGDFTPALNQAAEGFSFIGNPYQAPLDMEAVLTNSATNMNTDVLYYWDPSLNTRGAYVTRTLSANTNNVSSSFTEILQPGQAVFVKKDNTATAATMTISETHKNVTVVSGGAFRLNNTQSNSVGLLRANLQASIDNEWQTTDAALALFDSSYTWDVTQEDASKMNNLDEEVSFVQNNTSLAIAKQNDASVTDELPIRLQQLRHTGYRWVFDLTNYSGNTPYLLDTEQNMLNVIENGTVFPFTAGSNATNRFKIVFQNSTLSADDFANNIKLYPNPTKSGASFYVAGIKEATVLVYNVVGQNIPVTVVSQGSAIQVTPTATLSQGIYLVSVTTTDGKTAQVKWIVE